jgi:hypothetical protein
MAATLDGRVKELRHWKAGGSAGEALGYMHLAAASGAFARLEVQLYTAEGWNVTKPRVGWRLEAAIEPPTPLFSSEG